MCVGCMRVYTCVRMCSPMHVHSCARSWHQDVFFYHCPPFFFILDTGPPAEPGAFHLARLAGTGWLVRSLDLHISVPFPSTEVTGACCYTCLLWGCQGSELKSSRFHRKPPPEPPLQPKMWILSGFWLTVTVDFHCNVFYKLSRKHSICVGDMGVGETSRKLDCALLRVS